MRPPQAGFTYSAAAMTCAKATTCAPIWLAGTQGEVFSPDEGVVWIVAFLLLLVTVWQRFGPLPYPAPAIHAKEAAMLESATNASIVTMTIPPIRTVKVLPERLIRDPLYNSASNRGATSATTPVAAPATSLEAS